MASGLKCKVAVAVLAVLLAGLLTGGCSCALTRVIDQATVTVRGLACANELNQKAGEGYDVREARAKWMQALDAYNQNDFARADELIDETYDAMLNNEKVAERVYYQSSGGLTVSGLLFRPAEGSPPWPTIIVNHPGFGTAGDFSDVALMIRDQGYLVFNPDYRGSGMSQGSHEGAKGEVDDVIAAIDYLESRDLIEGERIGLYGQSHGAAISVLAAERDARIKAVVAEAGFYDAVDLYNNAVASSDPTVKTILNDLLSMVGGTPDEVPREYEVRSALNYTDSLQAATLLIHGEKDPICPVGQARRLYDALSAAGKTVEIKLYPDEAHCVVDPAGRLEVWELMFAWFEKNV
ncbi:MAG: alpha/beta fold hydrolase [Actinomycetota bacterium]|nr:alpha/beta fold hydrolase [Actinomycetota bacterium]